VSTSIADRDSADLIDEDTEEDRQSAARLTPRTFGVLAGAYGASRATVYVCAQVVVWLSNSSSAPGYLARWDGAHYIRIAQHGYPALAGGKVPVSYAFFPAWPIVLRVTHRVFGGAWSTDGLGLSFVLGFAAMVAIWFAVASVLGADTADRTAVLFVFLPGAYVLSMIYSESLFIACCALTLYALQRKWWIVAGVAAAVGGATRIPGVVLVVCCLVAAIVEIWRRRGWLMPAFAALVAPTGLVGWLAFQWHHVGSPTAFATAQRRGWNNGNSWGITALKAMLDLLVSGHRFRLPWPTLVTVAIVPILAGVALMVTRWRSLPITWLAYTVGVVWFGVSVHAIWSIPRLMLPAFIAIAMLVERLPRRTYAVLLGSSAALMTISATLVLMPHVTKFSMAP
jgi:Gpi18-like mannosyltransferase